MVARPVAVQKAEEGETRWSEALRAHHEIQRLTSREHTHPGHSTDHDVAYTRQRAIENEESHRSVPYKRTPMHLGVDNWDYERSIHEKREGNSHSNQICEEETTLTSSSTSRTHSLSHATTRSSSFSKVGHRVRSPDKKVPPIPPRVTSPAYRRVRELSPGSRLYTDPHTSHTTSMLAKRRGPDSPLEKWGPLGEQQQKQRAVSAIKGRDIFPKVRERERERERGRDGSGRGASRSQSTPKAGQASSSPSASTRSQSPGSSRSYRPPCNSNGLFKSKLQFLSIATHAEQAAREALVWGETSQRQVCNNELIL